MKLTQRESLLATVLYADIFDYPLRVEEVVVRMIVREGEKSHVFRVVRAFHDLRIKEGYVRLLHQKKTSNIREQKEKWSKKKWMIARLAAKILSMIPSVILVGVTGGLALNNADRDDDIDLFVITKKNTLWSSRFFAIILMEMFSLRRRPGAKRVNNTICLNMFMTEDGLSVQNNERDLFTAYEIIQMFPLWEREASYRRFLHANRWVRVFLPNAWRIKSQISKHNDQQENRILLDFGIWILRIAELPSRAIQLWYMKKRRTTEVIAPHMLRFHPHDARGWIKVAFGARLSRYNLPLDKIFYGR